MNKKNLLNEPLITVITVVFNGLKNIENTILSVINQTYKNIEYIVIDGGSTDGTVSVLEKYSSHINYWISEPDKGIYDAMNKGIKISSGEWVNLMNCGDVFISDDVVEKKIVPLIINDNDIDIVVGSAMANSPWGEILLESAKNGEIWKGFCHQSIFENKKTALVLYDTKLKHAADFKHVYEAYIRGSKILTSPNVIALVDWSADGHTANNYLSSLLENLKTIIFNFKKSRLLSLKVFLYWSYNIIKASVGQIIKFISPLLLNKMRFYKNIFF